MKILAGDIGGTKTNLALFETGPQEAVLKHLREKTLKSGDYSGIEVIIEEFLRDQGGPIDVVSLGIAGPIQGHEAKTTNLPWVIKAAVIKEKTSANQVFLLNDLQSTAYGALFLEEEKLFSLQEGGAKNTLPGNQAVIAAGTGLGQAYLFWNGKKYIPVATEGGHVDFAPRSYEDYELLDYILKRLPTDYQSKKGRFRISYERVLSGNGLYQIFSYLTEVKKEKASKEVLEALEPLKKLAGPLHLGDPLPGVDPAQVIGQAGVAGECSTCQKAVDWFLDFYGAQAGNLALTVMATGGCFVGGGIITKMLPRLKESSFLESFLNKGRFRNLMEEMPLRIILDPKTSLWGAAYYAQVYGRD